MTIVLTSYFNKKQHPQFGDPDIVGVDENGRVKEDSFDYIANWYHSIIGSNCFGLIFTDAVSKDFIKKYTNQNIGFVTVDNDLPWSLNDARFFYYRNYMRNIREGDNKVFMTDISDVVVKKDPADLNGYGFYGGDEEGKPLSEYRIAFGAGNYFTAHEFFNWDNLKSFKEENYPLINAGVLGGTGKNVKDFLKVFCDERENIGLPQFNINMCLINYVLRKKYGHNIKIGEPINSRFKKYESDRDDVYFVHK